TALVEPQPRRLLSQVQKRTLVYARFPARESGSTNRGQSTRRRAATHNVQLDGATNARPFRRPSFLPNLHFEFAASCAVRFPNADKFRPSPPPRRANVCRPVLI